MPDCYVVVAFNPDAEYVHGEVERIIAEEGLSRAEAFVRYDPFRQRAHIFLPAADGDRLLAIRRAFRNVEGVVDFAVVDTIDETRG